MITTSSLPVSPQTLSPCRCLYNARTATKRCSYYGQAKPPSTAPYAGLPPTQPRTRIPTTTRLINRPSSPCLRPPPYSQIPPGTPMLARGCKRAVICAVSYKNSKHELKGCINDAKCMKYLLVNRFHFPDSSNLMLTEEETDPNRHPTKQNMIRALHWLVQGCQPGDSSVFHYSGHGKRKRNYTGDEVDGYDENLCPVDFKSRGLISDDEINAMIVRPLPRGVKLHAFMDACHSGTALDLAFPCRIDRSGRYVWEDHRPPSGVWKGTNGGKVIRLSGCDDHQTSADASNLSTTTPTGVMTFSFTQAIEHGHGTTYGSIMRAIRSTILNTENEDRDTSTSSPSLAGRLTQEPQITSSKMLKRKKKFSL